MNTLLFLMLIAGFISIYGFYYSCKTDDLGLSIVTMFLTAIFIIVPLVIIMQETGIFDTIASFGNYLWRILTIEW